MRTKAVEAYKHMQIYYNHPYSNLYHVPFKCRLRKRMAGISGITRCRNLKSSSSEFIIHTCIVFWIRHNFPSSFELPVSVEQHWKHQPGLTMACNINKCHAPYNNKKHLCVFDLFTWPIPCHRKAHNTEHTTMDKSVQIEHVSPVQYICEQHQKTTLQVNRFNDNVPALHPSRSLSLHTI